MYLAVLLFLVTRAAWVSLDISIKCVGASLLPPSPFLLSLCAPDNIIEGNYYNNVIQTCHICLKKIIIILLRILCTEMLSSSC